MVMTENTEKGVMVYGVGYVGRNLLLNLSNFGIEIFSFAFKSKGDLEELDIQKKIVKIVSSSFLKENVEKGDITKKYLQKNVICIVVAIPGEVLDDEIKFLSSLGLPMIVCSTGFNQDIVTKEVEKAGISAIFLETLSSGGLELLKLIKNHEGALEFSKSFIYASESSPTNTTRVSDFLINLTEILQSKGSFINYCRDHSFYEKGKSGSHGNIKWIRDKETQKKELIPDKYIDDHYIFSIIVTFASDEISQKNMKVFYNALKPLEKSSRENLEICISKDCNDVIIRMASYGGDERTLVLLFAMKFLGQNQVGIYSGLDLF